MARDAIDAFGREAASALALWAIDALVYPPAQIRTITTSIPAREVDRGRRIMDAAGVDWRALKNGDDRSGRRAGT